MSDAENILPGRKFDLTLSDREKKLMNLVEQDAKELKLKFDFMTALLTIRMLDGANPLRKTDGTII